MTAPAQGLLHPLARWVESTTLDDLPDEVTARGRHVVLNNLGCLLLGSESASAEALGTLLAVFGEGEEAYTPVSPRLAPAASAAMVNATLINGTELSEGVSKAVVHPGTVLTSGVLAEGQRLGASGADALLALVCGYETLIRVGWAAARDPEQPLDRVQAQTLFRGWYPPALLGGFGVAAAVCKLHGANAATIEQSFGIVSNLCPTTPLAAFKKGVDAKSLGCGWAAALGILAARLALQGYTGGTSAVEDLYPLLVDRFDPSRLDAELGERFEIMTLDVKFSAAGPILCEIECAIQIREQHDVDPAEVERIDVQTNARTMLLSERRPRTASAAKFSGPYCIAQGLLGRNRNEMMVEAFEKDALASEDWHSLADTVHMTLNDEFERAFESNPPRFRPTQLTLTLRDGRRIEHRIEGALGIPGFPPAEEDFVRKYRYLATRNFDTARVDDQVEAVLALDRLDDVRSLMALYRADD